MFKRNILILIFILLLAACTTVGPPGGTPALEPPQPASEANVTQPDPTHTPTEANTEALTSDHTATPEPATYFYFEPGINPLTGLPVADPAIMNRRPMMVKVSNWPREGRPHAGLTSADIVFEYFIGHQMNRFLAVYYGADVDLIGPVRSGRLVDAQLVSLYQGILAYGDADPQVDDVLLEVLGERALAFHQLSCPAMCGYATHSATGVYANSGALTEYAVRTGVDNTPPDLRGMWFQTEPPAGDDSGASLRVEYANFSIMQWHFDPDSGSYHLWMEAQRGDTLVLEPITDRNNDLAVAFDNLIVVYAEYIEYKPSLHDVIIQNVREYQPALFFRDGSVTYGTWRVPEPDRPIIFETSEGTPMPLKPGKTWVVIVGNNSQTVQPLGGEWEIYFNLP